MGLTPLLLSTTSVMSLARPASPRSTALPARVTPTRMPTLACDVAGLTFRNSNVTHRSLAGPDRPGA